MRKLLLVGLCSFGLAQANAEPLGDLVKTTLLDRVSAVSQLTISASNELGEFESGVMASLLGPVGAVVFGGIGAIVVTLGWARLFPELGAARTFDAPDMLETEPQHGEAKP